MKNQTIELAECLKSVLAILQRTEAELNAICITLVHTPDENAAIQRSLQALDAADFDAQWQPSKN